MSDYYEPTRFAADVNKALGFEFIVGAPFSYANSKRGPRVFQLRCAPASEPGESASQCVERAKALLVGIGFSALDLVNAWTNDKLAKDVGILNLSARDSESARQLLTIFTEHAAEIKLGLQSLSASETERPAPIKAPQRPSGKKAYVYRDFFGVPWNSVPTEAPEMQALGLHALGCLSKGTVTEENLDPLSLKAINWVIPTQVPAAFMFVLNEDGKIAAASREEEIALLGEHQQRIKDRQDSLLLQRPMDRMFDADTGQIVTQEVGTIHQALRERRYTGLGPATYWNPDAETFYVIFQRDIDRMKAVQATVAAPKWNGPN